MQGEAILGEFKPGVGRLIMRCEKLPIIVPIYHIGMHRMAPEKPVRSMSSSSLQKFNLFGQKATVYFGKPIDLSSIVRKWKNVRVSSPHLPLFSSCLPRIVLHINSGPASGLVMLIRR